MWFPDDPLEKRITANGRPQPGNRVRIVDPETGAPCAAGAPGEIQMQGPDGDARLFQSARGDRRGVHGGRLAAFRRPRHAHADGELVYIARLKEIIRVGGENLAPAEVEQALRDACRRASRSACSAFRTNGSTRWRPRSVVVAATCDWQAVLASCASRLAGFKMPRQIYTADALPMTATNACSARCCASGS